MFENNGTVISSDLPTVTLKKKKEDGFISLIVGSLITILAYFLFGWFIAIIVLALTIGFSIKSHKVPCPKCNHTNSVSNHSLNITCSKCKSLTLIDWM